MKKLAIAAALVAATVATPASAQWAGQWQPATTAQPTTTTNTVPAPVPAPSNGGQWQPGQPAWGTFGGDAPVMDANSGRYISDGRVENPVTRVVYDEPGRRGLYRSQEIGNYVNMGMSVVGLLGQVFAPRQQPQPAAPAQPANNGLAQCTANGQPSGVFVDNSDGQGLARCNAIFNR